MFIGKVYNNSLKPFVCKQVSKVEQNYYVDK